MTESVPPAALSPVDEARVSFALYARKLAEHAYDLIPLDPDAPRGERLRRALALREILDALIDRAAVAEREEGSTWTVLGSAAGITRQSASERWGPAFTRWSAGGRTALKSSSGLTAMDAVAALDTAYARLDSDHPRNALSSGLDAIRFPGAEAAEKARTERAAATRARLAELSDETRLLRTRFRARTADGGTAAERASLLRSRATVQDEGARLLDELAALEPELADEHRTRAEEARSLAAADREFADLLAPQNSPAGAREVMHPDHARSTTS